MKYFSAIGITLSLMILFSSCEDFFNPDQELKITEDKLFDDWYEYRSVAMGLYGLQQQLVEQLIVLGELRSDLLTVTQNADADLIEINNFSYSKTNKYVVPTNFFKLISASNNFIRVLERKHSEVLDPASAVTNFDRLYGEALCMRAWAYFNAARIYGKVPFIHESLVTMNEIDNYINTPGTFIDSVYITFDRDGYHNDTLYNHPVTLEKKYMDLPMVIDYFTNELETKIKAVGVVHYIDNNDISWEVTIWNSYAMHALLGQMYLTQGDYSRAVQHFNKIILLVSENNRYQLDYSFAGPSWRNIFTSIDSREHIFTIWFNKANFQQNNLQALFEPFPPHKYMIKPTAAAISKWEGCWRNQIIAEDLNNPAKSKMTLTGFPSDYFRGFGSSFLYVKNGQVLPTQDYINMRVLSMQADLRGVNNIMDGVDTAVYKFSINKNTYDQDANLSIYRAAGIHLYLGEIYTYWAYDQNGLIRTNTNNALAIINDGTFYTLDPQREQQGVRGRVGLANGYDAIKVANIVYIHDPYTNEIKGYKNLSGNLEAKQFKLEEDILDERVRELAFEGERFYDLMRVAKRRNDPSFLAKRVSDKFPAGKKEQIYNYLMDEKNWYINYFNP